MLVGTAVGAGVGENVGAVVGSIVSVLMKTTATEVVEVFVLGNDTVVIPSPCTCCLHQTESLKSRVWGKLKLTSSLRTIEFGSLSNPCSGKLLLNPPSIAGWLATMAQSFVGHVESNVMSIDVNLSSWAGPTKSVASVLSSSGTFDTL